MAKASGGTRTVSSANAAASRTFAQSAIGGGNSNENMNASKQSGYKELSQKDYFAALDKAVNPIVAPINDKLYSFKNYLSIEAKKYIDSKTEKGFYDKVAEDAKDNGIYGNNFDFADMIARKVIDFYAEKKQKELNIGIIKSPFIVNGKNFISIAKGYSISMQKLNK